MVHGPDGAFRSPEPAGGPEPPLARGSGREDLPQGLAQERQLLRAHVAVGHEAQDVRRERHLPHAVLAEAHAPSSEIVVEWRACTVALLDRVAERVRDKLGLDAKSFPLAKVLEGGTWQAGRELARERRPDGTPPIRIASDGTVF